MGKEKYQRSMRFYAYKGIVGGDAIHEIEKPVFSS